MSDMQAIEKIQLQFPLAAFKFEFQEILLSPKYKVGSEFFEATNSRFLSTSATDSTSITLYYENYVDIHAVLRKEDIGGLRCIAEMLNSTDYLHDCAQLYIKHRRDVVNMIYRRLHKQLNVKAEKCLEFAKEFKEKMQLWLEIAKICTRNIFTMEKCFFEQIFGGMGPLDDTEDDVVHIIGDAAAKLFEYPHSLVTSRQFPQRPEILIPLYQELLDLMPSVNEHFHKNISTAKQIHANATRILFQIAHRMTRIISALERQVLGEQTMIPMPGGKIHPMTEYVISYIDLISSYRNSLNDLIETSQVFFTDRTSLEVNSRASSNTDQDQSTPPEFLKHHAARIIEFLLCNLRHKSKFYKQESLGHLFMMNNVYHVAERIKSSQGMQEIVDNDSQMKLTQKVEQAISDYLNTDWSTVCDCLRNERSILKWGFFSGSSSTRVVKEKFKTFNQKLEYVHQTQVEWAVRDLQLRKKLHESILNKLIPAYSLFLDQFGFRIDQSVQQPERYKRYSVGDLEMKILDLFQCQILV